MWTAFVCECSCHIWISATWMQLPVRVCGSQAVACPQSWAVIGPLFTLHTFHAGATAASATMPLDFAKTVLQTGGTQPIQRVFANAIRNKGVGGLFAGMVRTLSVPGRDIWARTRLCAFVTAPLYCFCRMLCALQRPADLPHQLRPKEVHVRSGATTYCGAASSAL